MSVISFRHFYATGKKVLKGVELKDFSLEVQPGEVVALVGEKAALPIAALMGKAKITQGEIYVGDHLLRTDKLTDYAVEAIPCDIHLGFPAKKPVILGYIKQLKKKKLPANEIDRRVRECAMRLDISHLMERKPRALSSSQKIRVALGAAALKMPRVVVLEDFFGITHPDYHETLQKAFSEATAALGLTVLFYTAQPTHAKAAGARIVEVN